MARKSHQTHLFRKATRDQTPGPGGDPQSVSYGPGLSFSPFLRRGMGWRGKFSASFFVSMCMCE